MQPGDFGLWWCGQTAFTSYNVRLEFSILRGVPQRLRAVAFCLSSLKRWAFYIRNSQRRKNNRRF